jgi:hypothetical protein
MQMKKLNCLVVEQPSVPVLWKIASSSIMAVHLSLPVGGANASSCPRARLDQNDSKTIFSLLLNREKVFQSVATTVRACVSTR